MTNQITLLKRKLRLGRALRSVYATPEGKVFFDEFLRHAGVTSPKFTKDPYEAQWNEGRRHLAMSYLSLLAQDDTESLIRKLEQSKQESDTDNE